MGVKLCLSYREERSLGVVILGFHHGVKNICALWDFMQLRMIVSHRRFGTTNRSNFQGLSKWLTLEDGTDGLSRNVGEKLSFFDA
jgi:hypothetical protein